MEQGSKQGFKAGSPSVHSVKFFFTLYNLQWSRSALTAFLDLLEPPYTSKFDTQVCIRGWVKSTVIGLGFKINGFEPLVTNLAGHLSMMQYMVILGGPCPTQLSTCIVASVTSQSITDAL